MSSQEILPTEPRRVQAFAKFLKSYMSIWTIVVAALPVPVTLLGGIPTYAAQKGVLATYTPLFCFLLLAFIFYVRHGLARLMFPATVLTPATAHAEPGSVAVFRRAIASGTTWLPAILILASFGSALGYSATLNNSIRAARARVFLAVAAESGAFTARERLEQLNSALALEDTVSGWLWSNLYGAGLGAPPRSVELATSALAGAWLPLRPAGSVPLPSGSDRGLNLPLADIPYSGRLLREYLTMFLCAEAACIVTAIREYLQDLLGLSERDLIGPFPNRTTGP